MILVFPKETYITTFPALYFLGLEHFFKFHPIILHCLTPASSRPIIHTLSCPIVHTLSHPIVLAAPCLVTHAPSHPIVHGPSQIIISSHPPEPAFDPFPKIGEE